MLIVSVFTIEPMTDLDIWTLRNPVSSIDRAKKVSGFHNGSDEVALSIGICLFPGIGIILCAGWLKFRVAQ